jgi:hypothetical protein
MTIIHKSYSYWKSCILQLYIVYILIYCHVLVMLHSVIFSVDANMIQIQPACYPNAEKSKNALMMFITDSDRYHIHPGPS